MPTTFAAPLAGAALFHSRSGGFPVLFCTYTLLDENGNDAVTSDHLVVIHVTALNGAHFRLRDADDIQRFLLAVGRSAREEGIA